MTTAPEERQWDKIYDHVNNIGVAIGLTSLAVLTSSTSQLTLAPVFGSIPSGISHDVAVPITFLFGFALQDVTFTAGLKQSKLRRVLPLVAVSTILLEYVILQFSTVLGVVAGPIIAGFVSCHVISILTAYEVSSILRPVKIDSLFGLPATVVRAALAVIPFVILERFFAQQLPLIVTHSTLVTPADVQLVIAAGYTLLCGSSEGIVVITWTLIILSYLFNPYGSGPYATTNLQAALQANNWTLLDRRWSTTGYISVLESRDEQYRVLRCDHSLLGGEWQINNERRAQGWTVNEPIYSVFSMLEAVRLLDTTDSAPINPQALVIGLGVGTAPKALIQHGVVTTLVELDAAVYDLAKQYFDLPSNHTIVLRDATRWLNLRANIDTPHLNRYDYIIHDVFTGGAEPLSLFTASFLQDLRSQLKSDGVAAINYAGDITMPLTKKVLNTIDKIFDRQCQMYSDDDVRKDDGNAEPFSNLIVFCRNSPGEIKFREPTAGDFLGSLSKRSYLLPKPEQRIDFPLREHESAETDILDSKNIRAWRSAQQESAKKHWQVMRTVLPSRVWELY